MNLHVSPKSTQSGSSLIVAMFICTLMAVSIGGYLSLSEQQYRLSMRSQEWNMSIAVVEAGVEEALEHLNSNSTNLNTAGWTASSNTYVLTRTLGSGSSYSVGIDATDPLFPIIVSRASASTPLYTQSFFPALASIGLTQPIRTAPTRAVRVQCSKAGLYKAAVVAKKSIDLKGNRVLTDSYDSSLPSKSTDGRYDPSKYAGDLGDIASNGGIYDSVAVENSNIYGRVHTGPDTPVTIGPLGGVGTHAWQATHTGFQDGYVTKNANFTFPDTKLPSLAGLLPPSSGTVITPTYTYNTNSVVSSTPPDPLPPGGVYTNVAYSTSLTFPDPTPEWVTTTVTSITTNILPNPIPSHVQTNIYTISVTSEEPPLPDTDYLGGVTTNVSKNKHWITYTYNQITGIDYTFNTEIYTFPTYTYTYDTVITTVTYATNYYDSIVEAGQTCVASSLPGKTLIRGSDAILVLPNGMDGAENIILEHGASLTLYVGGSSVAINGNQVVNPSGFAGNFIVLCDPSVKSFTLNGNGEFTGVLVAPEADLVMNGAGVGVQDFCGALMCNNLRLNGKFSFHYDEALGKGPSNGRFLITSWDEIK